jgi:hypothetical protein
MISEQLLQKLSDAVKLNEVDLWNRAFNHTYGLPPATNEK